MAKKKKKWIQKAVKRPGRMTKACKKRGYKGATCSCVEEIFRTTKDKSLKSAALLAMRFKGCKGKSL